MFQKFKSGLQEASCLFDHLRSMKKFRLVFMAMFLWRCESKVLLMGNANMD